MTFEWQFFYPPIFGIPGVVFINDAGITGSGSPVLGPGGLTRVRFWTSRPALPQLSGDKKAGGDPYWRAELTVSINCQASTPVFFRFVYDSDFSTNCQLSGQFMGLNCAVVAPQLLPYGDKVQQEITFTSTAPMNAVVGGATYTPRAQGGGGPPVTFSIDSTSATVCSMNSDGSVSFNAVGTCTIDANQAAGPGNNITYLAAPQVQQSFNVS